MVLSTLGGEAAPQLPGQCKVLTLPTILIPKGFQRHPINGWVPGQARPSTTIHVPTSFTILAKVGSHSRRGFTQEYHPSHLR